MKKTKFKGETNSKKNRIEEELDFKIVSTASTRKSEEEESSSFDGKIVKAPCEVSKSTTKVSGARRVIAIPAGVHSAPTPASPRPVRDRSSVFSVGGSASARARTALASPPNPPTGSLPPSP